MASLFRRGVLVALLLALLTTLSTARSYSSHDLPSPQNDPSNVCRRGGLKSAVCDPDGFLSQSDADTLDGIANFIEAGTNGFRKLVNCPTGPAGAQVAVAIFESMSFRFGSKEKRAFQFAKDLHDRWGVGDAKCQNGVVVVVSVKDRAMAFSIGKGVNTLFTDKMLPKVMDIMKTKLRSEQYGQALIDGITAIGNIVSGAPPPQAEASYSDTLGFLQFILFGAVISCCTCAGGRRRTRYHQCKKMLEKIDHDRAKANNNEYVATSCPICLEDFPAPDRQPSSTADVSDPNGGDTMALNAADSGDSGTTTVRTVRAGLRQTAAGRASANASEETAPEDEIRTLPCGHKFHEKCIVEWFSGTRDTNRLCPICRQPILEEESARSEPRTDFSQPGGWDEYDPEYSFRVQRARHYYPDFITWSMINDWERNRHSAQRPMATSSAFAAVDPAVVAASARSSGSGGSGFSFGGGSSAGGGGGGGGW